MVDFKDILPNLQCLSDATIAKIAFQFTGYSLEQCEVFMQLLLQNLIAIIYENKNSPEKMEQITALLIMTRVDEVVNTLGNMGVFNRIAGINMDVPKGGSYFQQFMKGGFTKASNKKFTNKKSPKRRNYKRNPNHH